MEVDVREHDHAAVESRQLLVHGVDPAQAGREAVKRHAPRDVGDPAEGPPEMVRVRIELCDADLQAREHVVRDVLELRAVHFVGVDEEHPIGGRIERCQCRLRVVAHRGEVDEPRAHEVQTVALDRTAGKRGGMRADRQPGVVVHDEVVDDACNRCERRAEVRLVCRAEAERARDARSRAAHRRACVGAESAGAPPKRRSCASSCSIAATAACSRQR